jgi:hypothetical protein
MGGIKRQCRSTGTGPLAKGEQDITEPALYYASRSDLMQQRGAPGRSVELEEL